MKYLQQASQYWEHVLFTTGGKVQYSKCMLYIIEWKFNEDGTAKMNENNIKWNRRVYWNQT